MYGFYFVTTDTTLRKRAAQLRQESACEGAGTFAVKMRA